MPDRFLGQSFPSSQHQETENRSIILQPSNQHSHYFQHQSTPPHHNHGLHTPPPRHRPSHLPLLRRTQPSPAPAPLHTATYTDTFDNVTTNPIQAIATHAGYQNNIDYSSFQLANQSKPLADIIPQSLPNLAVITPETTILSGDLTLSPQNTAVKSAAIRYFDLLQLYFACNTAGGQAAADAAIGCGVEVSGYNVEGQMVGIVSFEYAPAALVGAKMALAVLPETFVGLVNYTVAVATSEVEATLTALTIDSVKHINYW